MRSQIEKWKSEKGCETVGVIVEPIMAEGGDVNLTKNYGQGLQALCKELGIYLIVDEVQTGVATTGKFWCHEHWDLPSPPDYVTFAKKMLSCGVYYADENRLHTPYRHFNTFMGDPVRALLTATLTQVVTEDKLNEQAAEVGTYIRAGLEKVAAKYPKYVSNVRGQGTVIAYDGASIPDRDNLLAQLKKHGIIQSFCGTQSTRLRPSLYFEKKHADLYLDRLEKACSELPV